MRFRAAYAKLERPLDDGTIAANRIKRRCGPVEAAVKSHTFPGIGLAHRWVYRIRMADVWVGLAVKSDLVAPTTPLRNNRQEQGDCNEHTQSSDSGFDGRDAFLARCIQRRYG